jgi:hypothetical protein
MSTGQVLRVRAAMKPISTVPRALDTVDVASDEPAKAIHQRSDVCAVPAAGVVAEAMVALVLAEACLEKFGGDSWPRRHATTRHTWQAIPSGCDLVRRARAGRARRLPGSGKSTVGRSLGRRLGVPLHDTDAAIEACGPLDLGHLPRGRRAGLPRAWSATRWRGRWRAIRGARARRWRGDGPDDSRGAWGHIRGPPRRDRFDAGPLASDSSPGRSWRSIRARPGSTDDGRPPADLRAGGHLAVGPTAARRRGGRRDRAALLEPAHDRAHRGRGRRSGLPPVCRARGSRAASARLPGLVPAGAVRARVVQCSIGGHARRWSSGRCCRWAGCHGIPC